MMTVLRRAEQMDAFIAIASSLFALLAARRMGEQHSSEPHFSAEESRNLGQYWVFIGVLLLAAIIHRFTLGKKWVSAVSSSTQFALSTVTSAETLSRIRSSVQSMNASSMRLLSIAAHAGRCGVHNNRDRTLSISVGEPFLPAEDTKQLGLSHVKEIFRFAASLNRVDRTRNESALNETVEKALDALEASVVISRCIHTQLLMLPETERAPSFADMDALAFVAACRLYAEWRSLRLVPDGYPRYAMSMTFARRDLLQNLGKIESAVHRYLAIQENDISPSTKVQTTSPTLRQILQHEIKTGVHPKLPCLSDRSGASGLIWTLRQIRYQTRILFNLTQIPLVFPNTKAANQAAYKLTYGKYHGFITQQIFQASLDAAPDAEVIRHFMNLPLQSNVSATKEECATQSSCSSSSADDESRQSHDNEEWIHLELDPFEDFADGNDDMEIHDLPFECHPLNPLERFGHHIATEWNRFMGQCRGFDDHQEQRFLLNESRHALDTNPPPRRSTTSSSQTDDCEITSYIEFMQPFLDDLDGMMEDLNMNDPSKV